MKRILCVYADRQVDSNLFMSSTIFNGLQQCGYHVDMVFMGYQWVCDVFADRYAKYFHKVIYFYIKESKLKGLCDKSERTKLFYSYYLHFLKDYFTRPYNFKKVSASITESYDVVLSFIPPAVSGFLAQDIRSIKLLKNAQLIQFWTDPLSLGRCNDVDEIPRSRFMHVKIERKLLSYADKAVFCYPLLCEMEQKLHPEFAGKMTWSDVGFTEHLYCGDKGCNTNRDELVINKKLKIGLFGSYHSKVRNIFPFLEAIKHFPDVLFILRGDSDLHINKKDYFNLDVVEGRLPVNEIEMLEQECDILLCLGGQSGITHPAGKVFYNANYLKPIVYIGDGVHNDYFKDYLRQFDRFIVCDNTELSIRHGIICAIQQLKNFSISIPSRLHPKNVAAKIVE